MPKAYAFTRHGGAETEAPLDVDRPGPDPGRAPAAAHTGAVPGVRERRTGHRRSAGGAERVVPAVPGNEAAAAATDRAERTTTGAPPEEAERPGGTRLARDATVLRALTGLAGRGTPDPRAPRTGPPERAGRALREVEDGHARRRAVSVTGGAV
ncbi:hypothetical protein AB0N31_00545 [Streptomyces sp. NPDC051051]|uniref:hypothetical protein n=1 Tax=Streptomyces sp. NPDC051051 TaxID=3155666 RepID=UPI00341F475A